MIKNQFYTTEVGGQTKTEKGTNKTLVKNGIKQDSYISSLKVSKYKKLT